jgi:DNA-binding winged helix-turn-helix (wHTH) protein
MFRGLAARLSIEGRDFRVLTRSSALLQALTCLESRGIDAVLLSSEYCEEELMLFSSDARRRGFTGLILKLSGGPKDISEINPRPTAPVQVGDFLIDVSSRRLSTRGIETICTPREFRLMTLFLAHPEELLSHRTMLEVMWGRPSGSRDMLRRLIQSLRGKIETTAFPRYIITLPRAGYRFIPSPEQLS